MNAMPSPTVLSITPQPVMGDRLALHAVVDYAGETHHTRFVGSPRHGGPVVMVTACGQMFVTDPDRFGPFGEDWVRAFYA